jgi:hypothetical protein
MGLLFILNSFQLKSVSGVVQQHLQLINVLCTKVNRVKPYQFKQVDTFMFQY